MLAEKQEVHDMIPQKLPMAMVDGLIVNDENETVSQLTIERNNIFCKDGSFKEPGIIENIAQTVALRAGYIARKNNKKPLLGYIGAVKKMKIYKLPGDMDTIRTKITILHNLLNSSVIKGEVYLKEELIAEGEMIIFKQN